MAGGRPTRYRKEYAEQARKLCLLGYTDKELADFFQVQESTINNWKKAHPEFLESLKDGKDIVDSDIVKSLYNRAKGMKVQEEKMVDGEVISLEKEIPPDPTSMIFWLKNRQPAKFRDKQDINLEADINITIGEDEAGL